MTRYAHRVRLFSFALGLLVLLSAAAFADGDRTQVGHNIRIGPDEQVNGATCFGCSIEVRGRVTGDVTAFGGNIVVEDQGQIGGDATVFGGNIRIEKQVKVGGDLTVLGGRIRRDPASSVGGDVTTVGGPGWMFLIFLLPLIFLGLFVALIVWLIRRMMRPSVPATA
jgi:hypothetical protein